ncbi:MAG: hypothetical protein QOK18_1559, partial [Mycobacterium sp.]|nr:hypothetical protein [Mycobacterium sp.]
SHVLMANACTDVEGSTMSGFGLIHG